MFKSFFIGGFECSTHRGRDGRRHDLIAATEHERFALEDFKRLKSRGIYVAREGLRWHLIEQQPERYDFSSVAPILTAAQETGVQILWDLFHYGFPDDTNPFEPDFIYRFALFAHHFAEFLKAETDDKTPFICPFNEISFFTYAAGERGFFAPYQQKRGRELKPRLALASIEGTKAFRSVFPDARLLQIDPVFHIVPPSDSRKDWERTENYRSAQFEGWDLISGRLHPEIGGSPDFLDIIGVNYYYYNQWILAQEPEMPGERLEMSDPRYRPFREILREVYERYRRPIFISETGTENEERPAWLRYICEETRAAMLAGVPVEGICWYPILNHPGWDDDRYCPNGLWDYPCHCGKREIYQPLAEELERQQELFAEFFAAEERALAKAV
ncbi:MAG: beta-glucosidase [Acidobacteriota bacterium]|nr:beta-glucosidase [Acidobacteriota bacterium]